MTKAGFDPLPPYKNWVLKMKPFHLYILSFVLAMQSRLKSLPPAISNRFVIGETHDLRATPFIWAVASHGSGSERGHQMSLTKKMRWLQHKGFYRWMGLYVLNACQSQMYHMIS